MMTSAQKYFFQPGAGNSWPENLMEAAPLIWSRELLIRGTS